MEFLRSREVFSGSTRGRRRDPSADALLQDGWQFVNSDAFLLHRIAIAQRDCVAQRRIFFAERLEINSHTEWRADFVLPSVPPADRTALIIEDCHVRSQKRDDLF